jgi:hypothetical protein
MLGGFIDIVNCELIKHRKPGLNQWVEGDERLRELGTSQIGTCVAKEQILGRLGI